MKRDADHGNEESAFEEGDHAKGQRDVQEGSQDYGSNLHEPRAPPELGRYRVGWIPNEHGLPSGGNDLSGGRSDDRPRAMIAPTR